MPHRILIVDDEESIRFAMRASFEAQGFVVDCAVDVDEATGLMAGRSYGAIIVDLRLAGIAEESPGLDLVRCVRRRWSAARILAELLGPTPGLASSPSGVSAAPLAHRSCAGRDAGRATQAAGDAR